MTHPRTWTISDLPAEQRIVAAGSPGLRYGESVRVVELEPVLTIVERLLALDLPQCQFVEDAERLLKAHGRRSQRRTET
jgi:hypothetical protein